MASSGDLSADMRSAAMVLLKALDDSQRETATFPLEDDAARRWIEYRPEWRPGARLALFAPAARQAAYRLLSTALSEWAYAQATAIIALEEVLDRREHWRMSRFSGDYFVSVFGDPAAGDSWAWRFEGHHLSVSMTVHHGRVSPAPVFFGANPACVRYAGRVVSRPLAPEEDLGFELLAALGPAGRAAAIVADQAPGDIRSGQRPRAQDAIEPRGIAASDLGPAPRALLGQLAQAYLDRLPAELAAREAARISGDDLHFAWEGPTVPGTRHYYRIQGDDLLIEYDSTSSDGNHAHSVLRRPRSDFGDDVLAAHLRDAHAAAS